LFDHLRELGREQARALRTAAKRATFSLVAVTTLGIGIGASTATFSIADAVLMRPLPVHEQRTLAVLWGADRAGAMGGIPRCWAAC
jgi:putative ABC transport system permease protein